MKKFEFPESIYVIENIYCPSTFIKLDLNEKFEYKEESSAYYGKTKEYYIMSYNPTICYHIIYDNGRKTGDCEQVLCFFKLEDATSWAIDTCNRSLSMAKETVEKFTKILLDGFTIEEK